MNIPAGYQISFHSWENDGDNYQDVINFGLTREDVGFYISLSDSFTNGGGNKEVSIEVIRNIVANALVNHPDISKHIQEQWDTRDEDALRSFLNEYILSSPSEGYDYEFCRAIDGYSVCYFPTEVKDVTSEFI